MHTVRMNFGRSRLARILKFAIFGLAALVVLGYASYRSLPYIQGPDITVTEPADGSSIATTTVKIAGQAKRVNALSINGMPMSIDEQGNFSKTILVFRGINIITIEAKDQFERADRVTLQVLGSY